MKSRREFVSMTSKSACAAALTPLTTAKTGCFP